MIYTPRLIDCETHDQQVVVLVAAANGQFADRCVKCRRDDIGSDGLCACGCGERLGLRASTSKYLGQRHRQKAHREDLRARASALGVKPSLSVAALDAVSTTTTRRSDGERAARTPSRASSRTRKPQLRVSYRKAVDAVEQALADGVFEYSRLRTTREQVEAVLGGLLTDRQRAAL